MKNIISIKEAREKKGLSINDLSKALKLDPEIIRLLEENLQLPDKFKAYQSTYKKSIYRYLGYEVKYKNSISDIPIDYTRLSIVYFLLLLVFTVLVLLSFNIWFPFSTFVPASLITSGTLISIFSRACTIPSATQSHLLIPAKILTNICLLYTSPSPRD